MLDVPFDQPVELLETGVLSADTLEEAYDRLNMQIRRVWRKVSNALTFSDDEGASSTGTADTVVGFDGDGNIVEIPRSIFATGASVTTSDTPPPLPVSGDLWLNSTTTQMFVYYNDGDSRQWVSVVASTAPVVTTSDVPPSSPVSGDLWLDTNTTQMFAYYDDGTSSQWVTVTSGSPSADSDTVTYTPDGTGAVATTVENKLRESVSVKDFGAVGDGVTDDTVAIDNSLAASNAVYFPAGVYVYTGTLILPESVIIYGDGSPKIANFPQRSADKDKLRPNHKGSISGSSILFTGTGTTSTYTTNRSDRFASVTPMVKYDHFDGYTIRDIAFIQDMDVLDAGGSLTTGSTDNRATAYTAGFVSTGTLSHEENLVIFGYFTDAGYILHNQVGGSVDPDYQTKVGGLYGGGVAIIGHDTSAGASTEGLTGSRWIGCGIYAGDHHTRADGLYSVPALYIDGYMNASDDGIRGHHFVGSNLRTYANDAISLDHVDDISFASCTFEFSTLAGVTNADAEGEIVGTANTDDIRITSPAATSGLGLNNLANTIGGSLIVLGGQSDNEVTLADAGKGIRLSGSGDDSVIQLTDDLSSTVSGWTIRRDSSEADGFDLRYDNVSKLTLGVDGSVKSPFGYARGTTKTIASGAITKPSEAYFMIDTEGASATDDLDTINGGSFDGEVITIRAANGSRTVVVKDSTGNIRSAGDFPLDNGQDRMTLMYDGVNWCETSRSDNT